MNIKFTGKDQNWQNETTTYWFELTGYHYGTDREFDGDVFGVVESWDESKIVDVDGCPLTVGDGLWVAVSQLCIVTEEHRMD